MTTKKSLGQFFTKNEMLQNKVYELILNSPSRILEPSIGRGDLINYILTKKPEMKFDMFEIDTTIEILETINKKKIHYGDFLEFEINKKYTTIIGNPPYIKTTKGNLYMDFIKKCFDLLKNNGELIFIIPSDFFKLTCAIKIINIMLENGTFTHIFHPHNEKLFENASIDVIVFRYCKNKDLEKIICYNNKKLYINNSNGLITFNKKNNNNIKTFGDYFDIYVGIVSGKDAVFKNDTLGNIDVLTGYDTTEKFIFIKSFPCEDNAINEYLTVHKTDLINRKIKKFNETNWFEWGAPRNIKTIEKNMNKNCIYIYNLTRLQNVAFTGKVNYFGGNLLMLIPKAEINLNKVIEFINSGEFKNNYIFSGRFKIGHRQLFNSYAIFK